MYISKALALRTLPLPSILTDAYNTYTLSDYHKCVGECSNFLCMLYLHVDYYLFP